MNFDITKTKTYSGYYNDADKLMKSTSGGVASAISEWIISQHGIVFGVKYSQDFCSTVYSYATTYDELEAFKGSKYIFTQKKVNTENGYESVWKVLERQLSQDKIVLFTGLGCDVAAAYSYLNNAGVDLSKFYTIELVCHGPAPEKIAKDYIDRLESKYKSRVVDFSVRYKKKDWLPPYLYAKFENGKKYMKPFYNTDYGRAFSIYSSNVCLKCQFRGDKHKGDLVVGDCWGLDKTTDSYNAKGVSLIIASSDKGLFLLDRLQQMEDFSLREENAKKIFESNHMYYLTRNENKNNKKLQKLMEKNTLHEALVKLYGGKIKYYIKTNSAYLKLRNYIVKKIK